MYGTLVVLKCFINKDDDIDCVSSQEQCCLSLCFKLSAINTSQKHVISLPLDPFMLLTSPVSLLVLHPLIFYFGVSLPAACVICLSVQREKI